MKGLRDATRGVRLRRTQEEKLAYMMDLDPELTVPMAIRRGVDLFIAEREAQSLGRQVYQDTRARTGKRST